MIARKVRLKEGQMHCTRCGGYTLFFVRIENNKPIPARPDNGTCYRCRGTGVEPYQNQNQNKGEVVNMFEITKELQLEVFGGVVALAKQKAEQLKKDPQKCMVSIMQIVKFFREQGIETTPEEVRMVISRLIQHKYIRYYKNQQGYTYYGVTPQGWTRYLEYLQKGASA